MTTPNGSTAMVPVGPSLAKVQLPEQSRAFEPGSIQEAFQLAGILVKSKLLPDSVTTPEAAFAIIATGRELGLTAMQSLRSIHVVKGRTILSADLVAALVKSRRDVCSYFQLVESTTERATYETQRVGEPKPTTMSFTMDDAKRAGVTANGTWQKYPQAMLRARCITGLARAVYPDLAMGIYDPDEFEEAPPVPVRHEVVRPSTNKEADGEGLFATLCQMVDEAETGSALNVVAKDAQRAHRDHVLSDGGLEKIKVAVTAKRGLLAPMPPPSEPKVEDRQPGEEG